MTCTAPCPGVDILDRSAFGQLAGEWETLLQRSYDNRIFLTPTWFEVWWAHFGAGEARVLTLRDEDRSLQAILPLQIVERGGERLLTLVGDPNVADYMDAVAVKSQAQRLLTVLWHCALGELHFDRVELRHVPSTSPLILAFRTAMAECGTETEVADDEVCPVAILCSSWDGYLEMLSKKQRHEIRRKLRRAQEGADWEWRTAATQADLDRDLPVFFRLTEAGAHEKARFMTLDMRAFFRALTSIFLQRDILRLSVFTRDGGDVAATLSFLYRGRYLLYNSGYDPAASSFSPGIASVALAMQDAIAEKAVAFDFLSGDEPYKYQFGASNTYTSRAEGRRG